MNTDPETTPWVLPKELRYPISADLVLRKRQSLKRALLLQRNLVPTRIAILGGSTTAEIKSIFELFLLSHGIQPVFYESEYNAYYEEVAFENQKLWEFKPDIVLIHTTWQNVSRFPELLDSEERIEDLLRNEAARFELLWDKIDTGLGAIVIQNNFDLPRLRPLGNLEASQRSGRVNFIARLNERFAAGARSRSRLLINDISYLSAQVGLTNWFDYSYWYGYHMAVSPAATVAISQNAAAIVKSIYGKTKKCLVLDLDNTLWGGVVGDDGVQNLILGRDHPVGEAYAAFQRYVKDLRKRGVLLAVCSKNDIANAMDGFSHPDSILTVEDFSAFKANWNPKPDNIREIAAELNIGLDSLVFVDDNPVERAIVLGQLPEVAVPDVGSDVSFYAEILEQERYFEPIQIGQDDLQRAAYYELNAQRSAVQSKFANYGEFLASLDMSADIGPFVPVYLERITQLINKSNQFNLTTRRYTGAEVERVANDPSCIALYGRLADSYGDNGLVSVIIGSFRAGVLEIDLWLMSCRVLKRDMELAMFDALVEQCRQFGRSIHAIRGVYVPSTKNGMVAGHYEALGFTPEQDADEERKTWLYPVPAVYTARNRYIRRTASPLTQNEMSAAGAG